MRKQHHCKFEYLLTRKLLDSDTLELPSGGINLVKVNFRFFSKPQETFLPQFPYNYLIVGFYFESKRPKADGWLADSV